MVQSIITYGADFGYWTKQKEVIIIATKIDYWRQSVGSHKESGLLTMISNKMEEEKDTLKLYWRETSNTVWTHKVIRCEPMDEEGNWVEPLGKNEKRKAMKTVERKVRWGNGEEKKDGLLYDDNRSDDRRRGSKVNRRLQTCILQGAKI